MPACSFPVFVATQVPSRSGRGNVSVPWWAVLVLALGGVVVLAVVGVLIYRHVAPAVLGYKAAVGKKQPPGASVSV